MLETAIPLHRTTFRGKCIKVCRPKYWDSVPDDIKQLPTEALNINFAAHLLVNMTEYTKLYGLLNCNYIIYFVTNFYAADYYMLFSLNFVYSLTK